MYNVVKTVEKDGRRIGFVLREINVEKNIYFSEEDTRILCSKNQVLNVRYTGKQFRKRQGRLSDFPVVQYNRIYPKSTNKPEVAYAKGHWVREISGGDFMENNIEIVSRKILYMGKTDKEHGLVNCKEFLDNIGDLSRILL